MDELKEKIGKICELKEKMVCELEKAFTTSEWSPSLCGEVVDMIKDLAETEEKCWKACYYKNLVKEMREYGREPRYGEPYGYDNRRYSSGKFAPKGRGHYSPVGYEPEEMMADARDIWYDEQIHGYSMPGRQSAGRPGRRGTGGAGESYGYDDGRYGRAWDMYEDSRRHYTETGSQKDKKEMDSHAMEHLDDVVDSTKEIMKHADSSLLKQMKTQLMSLINDIPV